MHIKDTLEALDTNKNQGNIPFEHAIVGFPLNPLRHSQTPS